MKKAYLVYFDIGTRIVIDPDDPKLKGDNELINSLIISKAITKVMKDINTRLENGDPEITEDIELPYQEGQPE